MAAKRETSLLDRNVRTDEPNIRVITDQPTLELGVDGVDGVELIGISGSANLYRGTQTGVGRPVVVKILNADETSPAWQAFERERQVTGNLSGHSGIAPLLGAGRTTGGRPYLVFPHYRRGTLGRLVAEHGRLGWQDAAYMLESIAVSVCEVHAQGFVHGDLNVDQVMLTDFLLPRITGFGRCRQVGENGVAPAADPTDDVLDLGRLLEAMVAPGTLPDALTRLVERATDSDRTRRPADAAAFVTALRRAVTQAEQADEGRPPTIRPNQATGAGEQPGSTPAPTSAPAQASTTPTTVKTTEAGGASAAAAAPAGAHGKDAAAQAAGAEPHQRLADQGRGIAPTTEARYILGLVACIGLTVLAMMITAILVVS